MKIWMLVMTAALVLSASAATAQPAATAEGAPGWTPEAGAQPPAAQGMAEAPASDEAASNDEAASYDEAAPTAEAAGEPAAAEATAYDDAPAPISDGNSFSVSSAAPSDRAYIAIGPLGIDAQGREGRIHTVERGHTLWDISEVYLGTPWVWPSIWIDNDEIADPHKIYPGDKIWITADEMRIVTDEEAAALLAARPAAAEPEPVEVADVTPVDDEPELVEEPPAAPEPVDPSGLADMPIAMPDAADDAPRGRSITVSRRESMGFLSSQMMDASTSIVDSPSPRQLLSEGDRVYLGMGEGEVEVGDQFTVFRTVDEISDIETSRTLGYHVEILGWLEVKELTGDTAIAEIRMSYLDMERGDRITPRIVEPQRIDIRTSPDAVEGKIVYMPSRRTMMADGGYVYVNRGSVHGLEVGTAFEVYEDGRVERETVNWRKVRTPDRVVAHMVVVTVQPDTSVFYVTDSDRDLVIGDKVRPLQPKLASR